MGAGWGDDVAACTLDLATWMRGASDLGVAPQAPTRHVQVLAEVGVRLIETIAVMTTKPDLPQSIPMPSLVPENQSAICIGSRPPASGKSAAALGSGCAPCWVC